MFTKHSISAKLTWMNILVSGAALLLACTAFIAYDLITFREATAYNLSIQAQIVGSNAVSALLFDDASSAGNTLAALRASPPIIAAGIIAPDGQPFALYSPAAGSQIPVLAAIPPGQTETHRFGNGDVTLVRSIVFNGKPVGTVYIISDSQRLDARLWLYVEISAIVLVISLLGALAVSPFFRRSIADPIVQLANVASVVSRDKNFSVRATPTPDRRIVDSH